MRRKAAEEAERVLNYCKIGKDNFPLDVVEVARRLGIKVVATAFANELSAILLYKTGSFYIGVNSSHSPARQRFSVAHELGHYRLHSALFDMLAEEKEGQIMFCDATSALGIDRKEIKANVLAANMIMPEHLVKQTWSAVNGLAGIMTRFGVSEEAAKFRCKNLNLL